MTKPTILGEKELVSLTSSFQPEGYSKDRALALVAAGLIAMVTEPGDRMAGALARSVGRLEFVELLIGGLDSAAVVFALKAAKELESCKDSFGDLESTLADSRQRWLPRLSKSRLEHLFTQSKALNLHLVTAEQDIWPRGLDDLQDSAPSMLFVEGNLGALTQVNNAVSIVGSRAASTYGLQVTKRLVTELAHAGRATVSGGAIGIDAQVHLSSVNQNLTTIAVMAGGLDRKYPKANHSLFTRVQERGALIGELPPGVAPTRWRFLQRNRLIAALSPTTVVIEAGKKSGSIRTANNALELDRELLAIPGSIFSGTSVGANGLIADSKALPLCDLRQFATGKVEMENPPTESALAKRAHDAVREIGQPTETEIAKAAGLTRVELKMALIELLEKNLVIQDRSSSGTVHYALKYGYSAF
jgi:DNA processing protein